MGLVTSLTAQHTTHTLAMPPKKKGAKDTQQRKRRGPPTAETIALRAKLKREAKQQAQSDARAAFVNSFRSSSSVQQPDSAFVADDGDDGHDVGDDDDDGGDDALAASSAARRGAGGKCFCRRRCWYQQSAGWRPWFAVSTGAAARLVCGSEDCAGRGNRELCTAHE